MAKCKQCGTEIEVVAGKVQRQFCSDAHRKAYKRAKSKESESAVAPSVDELRTNDPKLPTSDSLTTDKPAILDNLGQGYQMTVMEWLFYRSAAKLKIGEHNFVSLPGRACYQSL